MNIRMTFMAASLAVAGNSLAAPGNPVVVSGQATFAQQGNQLTITNSPNTIINWSSFSVAQGEMVRFLQQSSNSAVLNRITGQDPSVIMGTLQSNGHVYLINPNGIVFGAGAQINVGGLVASSLAMSNEDFLSGTRRFSAGDIAGAVSNQGAITTPSGGQVYLIAPDVTNSGIITTPAGETVLAAGRSVQLVDSSNPGLHVVVSAAEDQALNLGSVIAQGGSVGIYGALINQRGTLNANSASVGANGKIVLKASGKTLLDAGSSTSATGVGKGGDIQVLGEQVGVMGNARIDASGKLGGGTVLVGGDYQGKNPAVMNAQQSYLSQDAQISADALTRGNGGKVVVWGTRTARVYGSISARGGASSGDGGSVETSGHTLDVTGARVDTRAAKGKSGTWLLDPENITVTTTATGKTLSDVSAFATNPGDSSEIDSELLTNATSNIVLQATNDITFYTGLTNSHSGVSLTAQAGNNINVNSQLNFAGNITLAANYSGSGVTASGTGRVLKEALPVTGGTLTITDSLTVTTPPTTPTTPTNPTTPTTPTAPTDPTTPTTPTTPTNPTTPVTPPAPDPTPTPAPDPTPAPVPDPTPMPVPVPTPIPDPVPVPTPIPTPIPEPTPVTPAVPAPVIVTPAPAEPVVVTPPANPAITPPSADICTIAPNSALCQVLSPPTASEPVSPVQRASNEVIKTVTTGTPKTDFDQVAFLDTKKTADSTASQSSPVSDASKADQSTDILATSNQSAKTDAAKKMFCN